jgi:CubicO group peptidase (beta-lactamase class C family)
MAARLHPGLLALMLLAVPACAPADEIDQLLTAHLAQQHVPGAVIAVVRDGRIIRAQGYGHANLEDQVPVTPETVFKIASISKQFLAVAVLTLVENGKLSLDDPATKFLDEAPDSWRGITVRHLLSHTAGLVREPPGWDPMRPRPDEFVVRSAYDRALIAPPGEKYQYSNLGYFVIAHIISRASGEPWPRYLRQKVLEPAGMRSTRLTNAIDIIPHRAQGYSWREGAFRHAAEYLSIRPSGCLISTVEDLARWDVALEPGKLLSASSIREMETPVQLNDGTDAPYGLGVEIETPMNRRIIRHAGSLPGFKVEFRRIPSERIAIMVLANGDHADSERLAARIDDHYRQGH